MTERNRIPSGRSRRRGLLAVVWQREFSHPLLASHALLGDALPRYDLMLQRLADKANRWEDNGMGSNCRKRVQIKTLAHLKALGEEIAATGPVVYKVRGAPKTLEQIGEMTDAQLNEIAIYVYRPDVIPDETEFNWLLMVGINNEGQSASVPGRFYMTVSWNFRSSSDQNHQTMMLKMKTAKEVAESCTRVVPWWKALARYPVVRTISKATAEQRAHDRKIRWQSAWLSFAVSAPVAVFCAWLTAALTPTP